METISIQLADESKQFLDEQVAAGGFATANDYVHELIEAERRRKAQTELESLIMAGLNSPASPMTKDDWAAIREEGLARLKARTST